jgi:multidrug efflux pump
MKNIIVETCIKKSRAIIFSLCLIFIYGINTYINIPKEDKPDVQVPIIIVSTSYRGISPADSARLITKTLENEIKNIDNIKKINSYSYNGGSDVIIEFSAGFDIKTALVDVRDKVDLAKVDFPDGTDEPIIQEVNLSKFPVLSIALYGDLTKRSLNSIAEDLKDKILTVKNVLKVEISGKRTEVLEVNINPAIINSYQLSFDKFSNLIINNNKLIPAGSINNKHGKFSIQVPGVIESYTDLMNIPIISNNNQVVKLQDIANVKPTFRDPTTISRTNEIDSIVLKVSKNSGSNIIETIANVKAVILEEKQYLPENLNIIFSQDESESIQETLSNLENSIILAIILSLIPIIIAIGYRSAFLVACSIPLSFLLGVLFISLMGYSLNIVVIFSLILSIGMLVDATIVICEYADRKINSGMNAKDAYLEATSRMWWPVVSATATTLVVFVPLFFWPGILGQFMKFMPITIIATVGSSLLVAYIFIPVLGVFLEKYTNLNNKDDVKEKVQAAKKITIIYKKLLIRVLASPVKFVLSTIAILIFIIFLYVKLGAGVEFFPKIEPKQAIISINARGSLSIWQKSELSNKVEHILSKYQKNGEIKIFNAQILDTSRSDLDLISEVIIEFTNWRKRREARYIIADLRNELSKIPGIKISVTEKREGPTQGLPLNVEIYSKDNDILMSESTKILDIIKNTDGVIDIKSNLPIPEIEWKISIDKAKAAFYEINSAILSNYIQMATDGLIVTKYRPEYSDDEIDIIVKFDKKFISISELDSLFIPTKYGNIPITNFTKRSAILKNTSIKKINGIRTISIEGDLKPGYLLDDIKKSIQSKLAKLSIDQKAEVKFAGDAEDQEETAKFLKGAFILALLAMFLLMLIQFNSFYESFIILTAVFLSVTGILLGLLLSGQTFGIVMCGVGIIALAGTVVNNNIILIDTYKTFLSEGLSRREAILNACTDRFRPILLTAITTILGLLPMVFGMNIDFLALDISFNAPSSQWWKQLSTSIAGGMAFSSILTLFFTPALLLLSDRLNIFSKK